MQEAGSRLEVAFIHRPTPGLLSIVIPVRDDAVGLADTLASITADDRPIPYEIVVANDGANPLISAVCGEYPQVQVVELSPHRGPGAARNAALRLSRGEYIAFLDADVVLAPNYWDALTRAVQTWDFVGGRVDINPEQVETLAHEYDAITAFDVKRFIERHHAATCNLVVRRALLDRVGGFDERFRSGEDTEFGKRAFALGAHMGYSDEMAILHPPRGAAAQRRKLHRIVVGRLELAQALPDRFDSYRLRPKVALALLLPPRRLAKDPGLLSHKSAWRIAALYSMHYANNLYLLGTYLRLTLVGVAGQRHDLS